jgi:hypothetical protein
LSHTIALTDINISIDSAIKAAQNLGLKFTEGSQVRLYDGSTTKGLSVSLPGWNYPVVIKEDGTIVYDNYHGHWGDIKQLAKFSAMSLAAMSDHSLENITIVETDSGLELIAEETEGFIL